MKRVFRILSMIIALSIMLIVIINISKKNNDNVRNNKTNSLRTNQNVVFAPNKSKINNQNKKVAQMTITQKKEIEHSQVKQMKISAEKIRGFLSLKKSEIIKIVGNIPTGTTTLIESHMTFPRMFVKKLGMTFLFPNETDDFRPICVYVENYVTIENIKGVKLDMSFKEVMDKLGANHIDKTWIASEGNTIYKIDYKLGGLVYRFESYHKEGTDLELIISLDHK